MTGRSARRALEVADLVTAEEVIAAAEHNRAELDERGEQRWTGETWRSPAWCFVEFLLDARPELAQLAPVALVQQVLAACAAALGSGRLPFEDQHQGSALLAALGAEDSHGAETYSEEDLRELLIEVVERLQRPDRLAALVARARLLEEAGPADRFGPEFAEELYRPRRVLLQLVLLLPDEFHIGQTAFGKAFGVSQMTISRQVGWAVAQAFIRHVAPANRHKRRAARYRRGPRLETTR